MAHYENAKLTNINGGNVQLYRTPNGAPQATVPSGTRTTCDDKQLADNTWINLYSYHTTPSDGYVERRYVDTSACTNRNILFFGGSGSSTNLKPNGNRNKFVFNLHWMLRRLGYHPWQPDGIFGNNTTNAVKNFQRDYGLAVDGIVGDATKNMVLWALNYQYLSIHKTTIWDDFLAGKEDVVAEEVPAEENVAVEQ